MLPVFCLRLAAGMTACLLVLPPGKGRRAVVNPNFYRTHFLTALGLACGALYLERGATWPVVAALGVGAALAFLGSLAWSLEGAPGGRTLVALTAVALAAGLGLLELKARPGAEAAGPALPALLGGFSSAALLGAALTAMLMGHAYLIAPGTSLAPLLRLLGALAVALAARMAVEGYALGCWTALHPLSNLKGDDFLWLPLRWGLGLLLPLGLCWMAWQTARIRSTQSATGILYVVVIFCFLGELTGQLLRGSELTL
jgi:hypothetical protein